MPEYLSPGVYVEEVDAGPKPIEGVSTSTAGAVGFTTRGPTTGKPVLVTSFAEFTRIFGGFLPEPAKSVVDRWGDKSVDEGGRFWLFPMSVKGFFDNGGQRLYVKRVFSKTSVASSGVLGKGLVAEIDRDVGAGQSTLKLRHLLGVAPTVNGTAASVNVIRNGLSLGSFKVASHDPSSGQVTLSAPVPQALKAGRDFVEIAPRSTAPVPAAEATLRFEARSQGKWGDEISVRVRPIVAATLNILFSTSLNDSQASATVVSTTFGGTADKWVVAVDDATGFAVKDHVLIGDREYAITKTPAGNQITIDRISASTTLGTIFPAGTVVRRLRRANDSGALGPTLRIFGAGQLYPGAILELDDGNAKETAIVKSVAEDVVTFEGNPSGQYFEGQRARLVEAEITAAHGDQEETFSTRLTGNGQDLVKFINDRAALVKVSVPAGGGFSSSNLSLFPTATSGGALALSGGDDGIAGLTVDDFVGVDGGSGNRTGIQSLEDIEEISICMVPGVWAATAQAALVQHCEALRYRFAILDPKDGLDIEGIRSFRAPFDSKYAALYYPWLVARDPLAGANVNVAPSGHLAGIYARVDVDRGVHKAPGNEVVRGILPGPSGLAQDVTRREQDLLNPNGINAIRFFPDRGDRVWGARTISSDASWKYINVRRLFIFVEASIDKGTQWVVFEPNDEPLWARVRQSVSSFLTTVWRTGALQGTRPEEAYFVKVDRTTMTQDDIDNGRLICLVGIAPVKPAEFVIFRIQQKTLDAQVS